MKQQKLPPIASWIVEKTGYTALVPSEGFGKT
jgi:hypothetical protein